MGAPGATVHNAVVLEQRNRLGRSRIRRLNCTDGSTRKRLFGTRALPTLRATATPKRSVAFLSSPSLPSDTRARSRSKRQTAGNSRSKNGSAPNGSDPAVRCMSSTERAVSSTPRRANISRNAIYGTSRPATPLSEWRSGARATGPRLSDQTSRLMARRHRPPTLGTECVRSGMTPTADERLGRAAGSQRRARAPSRLRFSIPTCEPKAACIHGAANPRLDFTKRCCLGAVRRAVLGNRSCDQVGVVSRTLRK